MAARTGKGRVGELTGKSLDVPPISDSPHLQGSPPAGLRFHDLKHDAITELAESQASDSTIMEIAGWVSPKMLRHYSHVHLQAKQSALDVLSTI